MDKRIVSRILIIAGCLCFIVPAYREVAAYPWATVFEENVNDIVLPDPEPPKVEYTVYIRPTKAPEEEEGEGELKGVVAFPEVYSAMPDGAAADEVSADETPEDEGKGEDLPLPEDGLWDDALEMIVEGLQAGDEEEYEGEDTAQQDDAANTDNPASPYVWLGIIKLPRIGISENLLVGMGEELHHGVGYLEGSALPGDMGNVIVAAHRVSSTFQPFRHLNKMQMGDVITIWFDGVVYVYEVFEMFVIPKEDTSVLYPMKDVTHLLTVITCDPVVYTGNRPNRLIVRARLIGVE